MSLSTLALLLPSLATQSREPFPPGQPLFALHGLGVYGVVHARVADLDGDGNVDVVTAGDAADAALRIHLGNGRGALLRDAHPEVQFPTGGLIRGLVLGDFDGGGDVEAAVLTDVGAGSRIFVCDNDGSGAMSVKETLVYFTACDRLAAADVDGDGFDDLVFTRDPNARINVLRSLGAAGFAPPLLVPSPPGLSGPEKYVFGDTTGDGKVDLVSLHDASNPAVFQYVNVGAGSFLSPVLVTQVSASTDSLSLGETRGDGVLHLVTSDWDLPTGPTLSWYENDGHGSFELRQRLDEARLYHPAGGRRRGP